MCLQKLNQWTLFHTFNPRCCKMFRLYSCLNQLTIILLYSSSIKLLSGTSASLWFARSSLKHALICFFHVSVMPSSQQTAFLMLYVLFYLLQCFRASCLCSRRRTSQTASHLFYFWKYIFLASSLFFFKCLDQWTV